VAEYWGSNNFEVGHLHIIDLSVLARMLNLVGPTNELVVTCRAHT
jgi:hypothetical protein